MTSSAKKTDYQAQGTDFLKKTDVTMDVKFLRYDFHFDGDKAKRDIYEIVFKRGKRSFKFNFGQSINASGKWFMYGQKNAGISHADKRPIPAFDWDKNKSYAIPSAYDVLTCLSKDDPGTFKDFCGNFGYDEDSRTAERTYKAVCDEWQNVKTIWTDSEIEKLQEIQ